MTLKHNAETGDNNPVALIMDNAIAIDNNHLTMNDTARTLSGDHESRVTDTGTSIVQPAVCKTLSAEGFDGMPDIQKGNRMPVVAIDGNKLCKNERAGGMGIGVAIGCDRRNQSGADEVQPALQSTVSDGGSTVAVGIDAYNQAVTGGASKPLGHSATDTDHTPAVAVGINSPQPHSTTRGFGEDVQPTFGAAAGESGNNKPMVALNHIVRRLTPTEAERLQGFPDGWTRIPYRGRPADECPDSPRYKALGNSWATNCAEYILRRIVAAFQLDMVPDNN